MHTVPTRRDVTTAGTTDMEFTFTGEALGLLHDHHPIAPDRTWTVTVPQVTGKAFVQ